MHMLHILISFCWFVYYVNGYRNQLFTIAQLEESKTREYKCSVYEGVNTSQADQGVVEANARRMSPLSSQTIAGSTETTAVENPYEVYQNYLHKFLFGENIEMDESNLSQQKLMWPDKNNSNTFKHYVVGNYMRSELFNNRSGVHIPQVEFLHRGSCVLKITKDKMQTAVNAFAIFLHGTLDDIERLPSDYVLRSARTISMMKIAREKLAATWNVVKAGRQARDISHLTLERYRPLFKYINGREMARLNLSDERILTYIGTHADLDRHQVGVVTSKYIEINKNWSKPRYLNIMNNLLCGVPMTFMRRLPISTYLQLSHQVFYHIRACDPLQRRFYLAMMTRTKALGKAFSWNARDVSRLGLLLTEVEGTDLSAINPEAMAGITAQVMMQMSPHNLQYFTENQLKYLAPKSLNILGRKLKIYNDQLQLYDSGFRSNSNMLKYIILSLSINLYRLALLIINKIANVYSKL